MSRTLHNVPLAAGVQATLLCPTGKQLRVLSIVAVITGGAIGGQVVCTFSRSNQTLAFTGTGAIATSSTQAAFCLGGQTPSPLAFNTDPVSGNTTYSAETFEATGPLPDVWWPYDITIGLGYDSGAISSAQALYELVDAV